MYRSSKYTTHSMGAQMAQLSGVTGEAGRMKSALFYQIFAKSGLKINKFHLICSQSWNFKWQAARYWFCPLVIGNVLHPFLVDESSTFSRGTICKNSHIKRLLLSARRWHTTATPLKRGWKESFASGCVAGLFLTKSHQEGEYHRVMSSTTNDVFFACCISFWKDLFSVAI